MRSKIIQVAAITSLVTALAVSALAYVVVPRLTAQAQPADYQGVTLYPAAYTGAQLQPAYYSTHPVAYQAQPVRLYRPAVVGAAPVTSPRSVYEPRQRRSTGKSVLIVAGSSAAGAGIGAMAGGKKGAAIGAISGGVAGLIYDRMTANPK